MSDRTRPLLTFVVALGLIWHFMAVLAPAWADANKKKSGQRDFASYYFAVQVQNAGGNPYDKASLGKKARELNIRRTVHPFFYPPPFLAAMWWTADLTAKAAYKAWFWLDEIACLLAMLALWRWWRPLGPVAPAAIAIAMATLTCIPNNHIMGQANLPVLALVIAGLWQADEGRQRNSNLRKGVGGFLVGVACMMKMAPAFFVMWWMLRRQWVAVAASLVAAVVLTVASLPFVPYETQLHFYTEVMPGFASGNYNGLLVPIDLFGNHSIPNIYYLAFQGEGHALPAPARFLATGTMLVLLLTMGFLFLDEPRDALTRAGQVSAVAVAMLLVPVYTYEHHLVWAIPAAVVSAVGLFQGRLSAAWAVPIAVAWACWTHSLQGIKQLWSYMLDTSIPVLPFIFQELKFLALIIFFAAAAAIGRSNG